MENEQTAGERAYEAYRLERGGVDEDGNVLVAWADLGTEQRAKWEEKAKKKKK